MLSKSILSEVVQNKASVLSSDATMDSRFLGGALGHHAGHPLDDDGAASIHHDELLGIVCTSTR